ncbi:unnamed protein product, partial [Staurois parvus]
HTHTILPKVFGHPSKSLDSGVPITSIAPGVCRVLLQTFVKEWVSLSEFKRVTVIGCHLCNKSIHEISLLLNIP